MNTSSVSTVVRGRKAARPATFRSDLLVQLRAAQERRATITWPSPRWRDDPVGFARAVLGIELWSAQVDILESIRDNRNTTVRSGHKCGKSTALAVAALWFYCSFDRARVVMTAVKAPQIDEVIWKEIRRLYRGARIPIGGTMYELARSGLRDPVDDRQIWGMTARNGEGLAGISGPNILVLVDEASGVDDNFFEVLGSSLAGSGGVVRKCYISNPTRTVGEFYKSHTTNKALFKCLHVSSESTPNARGTGMIPGLAGPEWIKEKELEYGKDSVAYAVRVKGEFVHDYSDERITLNDIAAAEARWDETPEEGDLQIGIDLAGDGVLGDETAMAVRRGSKIMTVLAWRGLSHAAIIEHALELLRTYVSRGIRGIPRIAVDVEGVSNDFMNAFAATVHHRSLNVQLIKVRASQKFFYSPKYHLIRDGLWGQTREWIRAGGAIPTDVKLAQELNAPIFAPDPAERFRWTDKKTLRDLLKRSPDRADAMCLAIWGYASVDLDASADEPAQRVRDLYEPQVIQDSYYVDGGASDHVYGANL